LLFLPTCGGVYFKILKVLSLKLAFFLCKEPLKSTIFWVIEEGFASVVSHTICTGFDVIRCTQSFVLLSLSLRYSFVMLGSAFYFDGI